MKALSVRQPWAWAIVSGHKTIENRSWQTTYRGPLLIHAGRTFDPVGYERLLGIAKRLRFEVPSAAELARGGVVGRVNLVEIVTNAPRNDPWFVGPFGWRLAHARKHRFRPLEGTLKLFNVDGS